MTAEADSLLAALQALDRLDISWALTGSFALAAHGMVRATQDADIKILVGPTHDYAEALEREMHRRGFSRIDEHTFEAPDGFIIEFYPVRGALDEATFARRIQLDAVPAFGSSVWVVTIDDLILLKLREFKRTRSHVQIDDVRSLLVLRRRDIDIDAIERGVRKHTLEEAWGRVNHTEAP